MSSSLEPTPELTVEQAGPGARMNGHWSRGEPGEEARTAGGMKVTDRGGDEEQRGLLESSLRLKPHEAQSWRRKALIISWTSVVITTGLSISAFGNTDDFLLCVSVLSGALCSVLAVFKMFLGRVLTSRALITDGFNSLVGALMGFSILLAALVFRNHPDVWFLDGTFGVLISVVILTYGIKLLLDMIPRVRQTSQYERFD
ncbi:transmembrane protein 163-like [Boleophthalmus pectinirostris]|uniref:transmembrane protein 163-like n=1 Tax=Boleophthalmus pectinirostris TaxID=150288 RepID=UPI00242B822E|nr:transmembrane protein 163-like [Boleophthalmus pectinirostris]